MMVYAPMMLFMCTLFSGSTLAAQGIEGRWETHTKDLVLDVSRCGEQFCGQAVNATNQCERTVLTVAHKGTSPTFDGELAVPRRDRPLKVKVSLTNDGQMLIIGDDIEPSLLRRTFPFRALLVRVANAACRPNPTS
jgi:uncharacterized protein (DUF2147 family)